LNAAAVEAVIEAAFWASLRREEGYIPRISLAFVAPEAVGQPLRFERQLPLAAQPLTRLAPAVERSGSTWTNQVRAIAPLPADNESRVTLSLTVEIGLHVLLAWLAGRNSPNPPRPIRRIDRKGRGSFCVVGYFSGFARSALSCPSTLE